MEATPTLGRIQVAADAARSRAPSPLAEGSAPVWSPMSAVSFDASSALLGGAPCGTPTRERDKTALCAARHAGSSRLPHCLSPAGKCQFHSGIPESDGRDVIVGVQLEASGRVGQPSLIRTDGLEGAVLGGGMTHSSRP